MKPRQIIGLVLLIVFVPLAAYQWHHRLCPPDYSIPAVGGRSIDSVPLAGFPHYLQIDTRWRDETVGGSGEQLANVGCTLCCVSMAFTQLGIPIDPKQLNSFLKAHDGYNRHGWLKWSEVASASGGLITLDIPEKPSYELIDGALQSNSLVVAKVNLEGGIAHWVLIVGKNRLDYIIKNPLCDPVQLQRLSSITDRIQAVRVIRKVTSPLHIPQPRPL